jgi:hypothetical protein
MILIRKADVTIFNHEDSHKNNVLHYCTVLGSYEIARLVLEAGVSLTRNDKGLSAYDICTSEETKSMLQSWYRIGSPKMASCADGHKAGAEGEQLGPSEVKEEINCDENKLPPTMKLEQIPERANQVEITEAYPEEAVRDLEDGSGDEVSNESTYSDAEALNSVEGDRRGSDLDDVSERVVEKSDSEETERSRSLEMNAQDAQKLQKIVYHFPGEVPRRAVNEGLGPKEIQIEKSPGRLFINFDSILGYKAEKDGMIAAVSIEVRARGKVVQSISCKMTSDAKIGEMLSIPIENGGKTLIRISITISREVRERVGLLLTHYKTIRETMEARLCVDSETIDSYHNTFAPTSLTLKRIPATKNSIIRAIKALMIKKAEPSVVSMRMSYLSDAEFMYVPFSLPSTQRELYRWLRARGHSYNMWFKGYVNIRGERSPVTTHLWKRRFIRWQGFVISVFNEHSGSLVGSVNLAGAKYNALNGLTHDTFLDRSFKLQMPDGSTIEIHCDNEEKYKVCLDALSKLLCY